MTEHGGREAIDRLAILETDEPFVERLPRI